MDADADRLVGIDPAVGQGSHALCLDTEGLDVHGVVQGVGIPEEEAGRLPPSLIRRREVAGEPDAPVAVVRRKSGLDVLNDAEDDCVLYRHGPIPFQCPVNCPTGAASRQARRVGDAARPARPYLLLSCCT